MTALHISSAGAQAKARAYEALLAAEQHAEAARAELRAGNVAAARQHLAQLRGTAAIASDLVARRVQ
jgi:hypothetical protein